MEIIQRLIVLEPSEYIKVIYKLRHTDWSVNYTQGYHGFLVLTSYRLVAYKEKGILNKSYELMDSIRLTDIADLSFGGTLDKYVSVNGIKYFLDGAENASLCEVLRQAAQEAKRDFSNQQQQQQIIVNVAPQKSNAIVAPPIDNQETVLSQCPHCQTPVRIAGAVFCEKCGQSITPIPPVTPAGDEPAKFCSACGTPLPATAAFCKKCGAVVENRAQDTVPEVIFCIYCGAENAGDAIVCHACKATIE